LRYKDKSFLRIQLALFIRCGIHLCDLIKVITAQLTSHAGV